MNFKQNRDHLTQAFKDRFGPSDFIRIALAPGRSNLIGEHTDYNEGFVLPIAVDRHTAVVFRPSISPRIAVYAEAMEAHDEFRLSKIVRTDNPKSYWANYVRGTAWALAQRGVKLKGGDLYIDSDLPRGAGLSSSASLEIAAGIALLTLAGKKMDPQDLAFAGQKAEHKFARVMCGIMDQTVVARAKAGHALMLDCRSIQVRHIPIALKGYSFAIFDTGVRHKLASSEYNKRRAECESAARKMHCKTLRGVEFETLLKYADKLTANEHKRARHVLTENMRVVQFAAALKRGDVPELGRLLSLSHQSLAQDYEVSCKELDDVVDQLKIANMIDGACPGARMTGGGFGGAVVALLKTEAFGDYAEKLKPYAKGGSLLLTPGDGAQVF